MCPLPKNKLLLIERATAKFPGSAIVKEQRPLVKKIPRRKILRYTLGRLIRLQSYYRVMNTFTRRAFNVNVFLHERAVPLILNLKSNWAFLFH